jgi:hypothetical protein
MQADYLYAVLQVAIGESVKSSQRIQSLYSFTSTITGTLLGLVVYRVRRLKWFILFGVCVWPIAMGLMVRYRGGESSYAGVIAGQVILGFAGGFFTYPTQASVQAETKHERTYRFTSRQENRKKVLRYFMAFFSQTSPSSPVYTSRPTRSARHWPPRSPERSGPKPSNPA